jgi:nitrile hydratase accessory protein
VTGSVADEVGLMDGPAALPRENGELVFAAPWEARAFAMAVAVVEAQGLDWDVFRHRLMDAIAEQPGRPYFESWSAALEAMVIDLGISDKDQIVDAAPTERAPL